MILLFGNKRAHEMNHDFSVIIWQTRYDQYLLMIVR